MKSVLEQGDWRPIDVEAKTRRKCLVRNRTAYAWARWSKNRWVYYPHGTNEGLDFTPREYRF